MEPKTEGQSQPEGIRCQYRSKKGHLVHECRKAAADRTRQKDGEQDAIKPRKERGAIRCFNCQEVGDIASITALVSLGCILIAMVEERYSRTL